MILAWILPAATAAILLTLFWVGLAHLRYLLYYRSRDLSPPDRGAAGYPRIYGRILKSVFFLAWWHLRAGFQGALRMPPGTRSGGPVLCVHGFHMNSTCMFRIRRALERRGRPTRSIFLGPPYLRPELYAGVMGRRLAELAERFPGESIDLVAHSMGGLVARLTLSENPGLASRVGRVVTLGAPHHGTAFLRWIRLGPVYGMMSRDSAFLRALPDFHDSAPEATVTTIAAVPDFVVYPEESAHLQVARNVTVRGVGHSGLLVEPRIVDLIADSVLGEVEGHDGAVEDAGNLEVLL